MLAAVEKGDAKRLAELIKQDPGFKVNRVQDEDGVTLLHIACNGDGRSTVIPLLLAHPDIDVNANNKGGCTPFLYACIWGCTSCVRVMLKDSRVKVNEPDGNGTTPLWVAANLGFLDVIKWWMASGTEMDLGKPGNIYRDVIGGAEKNGKTEVVALLERFKENPAETRRAVRMEVGWYDEGAAEVFALVVFVSDGLFQIKVSTPSPAARFFNIARRLPLELQMLLCFRQVESAKEIISGKDIEVAFKFLAKGLLWSSIFTN